MRPFQIGSSQSQFPFMHTRGALNCHHRRRFRKSGPFCASFRTTVTLRQIKNKKTHAICRPPKKQAIEKCARVWERATGSVGVLEAGWCALLLSFHGDASYIWQRDARRQLGLARLRLLLQRGELRRVSAQRERDQVAHWSVSWSLEKRDKRPSGHWSQQPEQRPSRWSDVFGLWWKQTSRLGFVTIDGYIYIFFQHFF